MKILLLEDRGSVSYYMAEALRMNEHEVHDAYNINDAQSEWETDEIDCVIVDLNLDPTGLSQKEIEETRGGLLSGWIWLRDHVLQKNPEMRQRTVIYSEYVSDLMRCVSKDDLRGIRLIAKGGQESAPDEVLKCIDKINTISGDENGKSN